MKRYPIHSIFNLLVKKYPNYLDLGKAVHKVNLILNNREKVEHAKSDIIFEKIEIEKIIKSLKENTFSL